MGESNEIQEPSQVRRCFFFAWGNTCRKMIIKISKRAHKKLKEGAILLKEKLRKLLLKLRRNTLVLPASAADTPIENCIEKKEELQNAHAKTNSLCKVHTVIQSNSYILHTKEKRAGLPNIVNSITVSKEKKKESCAIKNLCIHIKNIEVSIRSQKLALDVYKDISKRVILYMVEHKIGNTEMLKSLERTYLKEEEEDTSGVGTRRNTPRKPKLICPHEIGNKTVIYISPERSRRIIANDLSPTLQIRYLFTQSPLFEEIYTSLSQSIVSSLSKKISFPGEDRRIKSIFVYRKIIAQIKQYIVDKTNEMKIDKSLIKICETRANKFKVQKGV